MRDSLLISFSSTFFLSTVFSTVTVIFFSKHKSELVTLLLRRWGGFSLSFEENPCSFPWPCFIRLWLPVFSPLTRFPLVYSDLANAHQAQSYLKNFCTQEFSLPGTSSTKLFMLFTCHSLRILSCPLGWK